MQNRTKQVLASAVAACALFAASRRAVAAPISYTGGDYLQNFDTLPIVAGNTAFSPTPGPFDVPTANGGTLTGWSFARLAGTNTSINFQVDNGSSADKGQVTSVGASGSTERALSSCATTASTPNFGVQLTNNSSDTYNSFTLTYTGEQWRRATAPANAGFLAFSYSTSATNILTGSFNAAGNLNFVAPNAATTVGALDGNAAGNKTLITATVSGVVWNPGQTLTLRWNDFNESGDDDWLGIDDLTFTGKKAPVLKWNPANLSGTWDTNVDNKPWLDETPAPSHFINNQVASLANTTNDIDIAVDSAGVSPAVLLVSNADHKYNLSGGAVSGPLVKSGGGTLVLKSINAFTSTSIDGGTVETQVDGALGQVNINLSNGATWKITTNPQTAAANNTVNITGSATIYTQTDLNMVHSINGANVIFTKDGPGLLWARHNFPLTGNSEVHVDGGTLRDSDDLTNFSDGIPDNVVLKIAAGATFDETYGNGEQFSALYGDGTYLGHHVANGAGHINFLNNTATTFTFNGLITAGTNGVVGTTVDDRQILALRKNGIHTAVLTNPNSDFSGQVQVNNGVLEIPHIANRGQNSPIGMGNIASTPASAGADITMGTQGATPETTGTLRYSGPNASTDRTITLNAGGGIIDVSNAASALTLSASIGGGGSLQKNGPGTLILTSSNNTFIGGMVVAGGTLLVNNAFGDGAGTNTLTVKAGGTVGGIGTITANLDIQSGGTLSPGESIGVLIGSSTTMEAGSKMRFELNSTDGSSDDYIINGVLDVFGQTTIDLVDLGSPAAKTFTLIQYSGGVNNFANLLIGTTPNPQLTYTLVDNQANQSIDLTVSGSIDFPQWNNDGNGSWGNATNWSSGSVPNGTGAVASFLGKITAPRTVTLDGDRTVAQIAFDNANRYTIAQGTGGTLTIADVVNAGITVSGTTHVISAPLNVAGAATINVANGAGLNVSGALSIAAGKTVTKDGRGSLTLSGAQAHGSNAGLVVARGTLNLLSNAGAAASAGSAASANLNLSINGNAEGDASKVVVGTSQNLKSLAIQFAAAGTQTLDLASAGAAGDFKAIRVYAGDLDGAKTSLYAAIRNANAAGAVNAQDGIIDSNKHTNSAIGIAKVTDAHGDQNVLIRATRIGDLNLDGIVTISDFIDLASNFNGINKTWQEGDLNYDGSVTISDFIDLASNFNGSYAGETLPISAADERALASFAEAHGAAAPEPGTGLLALGGIGLVARRRRRV